MDNRTIWETARWQSAVDAGCRPEDFLRTDNVVVPSRANPGARRYLTLPFDCHLISYGSNIVASVQPALSGLVRRYIDRYPAEHCFETPNLHVLNDGLQRHGLRVCFMAEYFLPDLSLLRPLSCPYETRLLTPGDFKDLYLPQWSNALCEKRKQLDVLGLGAYDGQKLIGLAGCSADCGAITICDSCCGAGATLIAGVHAARKQLEKENLNYQNHVLVVAQDIDEIVALMCYIQLSLLGVAAYIKVGNTFTEPIAEGD